MTTRKTKDQLHEERLARNASRLVTLAYLQARALQETLSLLADQSAYLPAAEQVSVATAFKAQGYVIGALDCLVSDTGNAIGRAELRGDEITRSQEVIQPFNLL